MISRLAIIMKSRLNRKLENFVQNEFEVANHIEMEAYLTLRKFCMKFLDFTSTFQNLQALATRLLHTIGKTSSKCTNNGKQWQHRSKRFCIHNLKF